MKIKKNNYIPVTAEVTCPICDSLLEIDVTDIDIIVDKRLSTINSFTRYYKYTCPCCKQEIEFNHLPKVLEKPMSDLNLKKFFMNNSRLQEKIKNTKVPQI